ncbi:MAG TPA: VOC family protein [Candidatus Tumulicola sp.]|nr:VOC family protein [Candidatus Tumulicola sp.]
MNAVSLIIYPASDVEKAKSFFKLLLGVDPYAESPQYTGFRTGEMEVGLVQRTLQNAATGALAYVTVDDINAAIETLVAAGAQKLQDVTDVGYGLLVASVKDPDGTPIGLRQFPPK